MMTSPTHDCLNSVDHYAVIGHPIQHSQSPIIHQLFAAQTKQRLIYTKLLASEDQLLPTIHHFVNAGGKGLNVTAPFKQVIAKQVASNITPRAALAGAVNTLSFREGEWFGDNTDGIGLVRDFKYDGRIDLRQKRIVILGAGGAVRGILGSLLSEQPAEVIIVNRTVAKATLLAEQFSHLGEVRSGSLEDVQAKCVDIIINGTSVGLGNELPRLSARLFHPDVFCYDLNYAHELTPFLQFAAAQGVKQLADGWGMLIEQAAEAFYGWRHVRPDTRAVRYKILEKKFENVSGVR